MSLRLVTDESVENMTVPVDVAKDDALTYLVSDEEMCTLETMETSACLEELRDETLRKAMLNRTAAGLPDASVNLNRRGHKDHRNDVTTYFE